MVDDCNINCKDFPSEKELNERNDKFNRLLFYYAYRFKQRLSGGLVGLVEGAANGYYYGSKWSGAGGFIAGYISSIVAMIYSPIFGGICSCAIGALTDRRTMMLYNKNFRYSIGSGGMPPIHGSLS